MSKTRVIDRVASNREPIEFTHCMQWSGDPDRDFNLFHSNYDLAVTLDADGGDNNTVERVGQVVQGDTPFDVIMVTTSKKSRLFLGHWNDGTVAKRVAKRSTSQLPVTQYGRTMSTDDNDWPSADEY